MSTRTLGMLPTGCGQRLIAHYGPGAQAWLDAAPGLLEQAGERWNLSICGYHDAGHASVIASATSLNGRPLLLKAWTDPARYRHEISALQLWAGGPTADVVEMADDLGVAALELVAGRPGGAERPAREIQMVAAALQRLHTLGRRRNRPNSLPLLADHLRAEMLPRIKRRIRTLRLGAWRPLIDAAYPVLADLQEDAGRTTVLHADLYRENVPFDWLGLPCLLDPLPMVGDAAFDWAFWTVYYDLGRGTGRRLAAAARNSRLPVPVLVPWCRALAVDGLLFYMESEDPRAQRMSKVLSSLSASIPRRDS